MSDADRSEADKAYAAAEALIAKPRETGWEDLTFDREETHALTILPPQIADLPALRSLNLDNTQVRDLAPLSGLTALRELSLRNTPVQDLGPLSGLTALTTLSLLNSLVQDLGPLSGLTALTTLSLLKSLVQDLGPLSGLTELEVLNLDDTQVSDVAPLANLTRLRCLYLDHTPVLNLRPLRGLRRLVDEPGAHGLTIKDCAAVQADPQIAEIAEIEDDSDRARRLFAYLEHWVPPERDGSPKLAQATEAPRDVVPSPEAVPEQDLEGFRYTVTVTGNASGVIDLLVPPEAEADRQSQALYDLLKEDAAALCAACQEHRNDQYAHLDRLVGQYLSGLGAGLDPMLSPVVWNAGNKLRMELRDNATRSDFDLDGPPPLTPKLRAALEAFLALHNAFVSGHSVMSVWDASREDPVDRHEAELDRQRMDDFVTALSVQDRVVLQAVIGALQELHAQSGGTDAASVRALGVERDSLENLIRCAVREALIEERDGGFVDDVKGDLRGFAVGGIAGQVATAATISQLVAFLSPAIGPMMAGWHGANYPMLDAITYLRMRAEERLNDLRGADEDEDPGS